MINPKECGEVTSKLESFSIGYSIKPRTERLRSYAEELLKRFDLHYVISGIEATLRGDSLPGLETFIQACGNIANNCSREKRIVREGLEARNAQNRFKSLKQKYTEMHGKERLQDYFEWWNEQYFGFKIKLRDTEQSALADLDKVNGDFTKIKSVVSEELRRLDNGEL